MVAPKLKRRIDVRLFKGRESLRDLKLDNDRILDVRRKRLGRSRIEFTAAQVDRIVLSLEETTRHNDVVETEKIGIERGL